MSGIRDRYCIVGIGETEYSRASGRTTRALGTEAVRKAVADAGLGRDDVDGMLSYHSNDSTPSLGIAADLGLRLNTFADVIGGGSSTEGLIAHAMGLMEVGLCRAVAIFRAIYHGRITRVAGYHARDLVFPVAGIGPADVDVTGAYDAFTFTAMLQLYEIVVQAIQPGFKDWTPYPVVIVELDEQRGVPTPDDGLRLVANLLTPDFRPEAEAHVAIGARVEVIFQPIAPDFVLPQFRLSPEPPERPLWRFPG